MSVLKSVFFILKEKILKQASYVNVKVMRKNSKRATVLQSLLVVIILLLSQQPKNPLIAHTLYLKQLDTSCVGRPFGQ